MWTTPWKRVDAENAQRNVICIVDESGSMSGTPLRDAQTALRGFISSLDDNLQMALVSFDDMADTLTEMGDDKAAQLAAVDLLEAAAEPTSRPAFRPAWMWRKARKAAQRCC